MTTKRGYISLETKLASALDCLWKIPHEHAKLMTAAQVISLAQWDHFPIKKVNGGPDKHWNLVPLSISEHRKKTAVDDAPEIAKTRRRRKTQDEFCRRMLAKGGEDAAFEKWAMMKRRKRQWPKRKLKSRNDLRKDQSKISRNGVWRVKVYRP